MQTITTIGLDIAKSVFQVHGVDAGGQAIVRRQLKRRYVLTFFQKLSPCLVGIEACASAHHWSREFQALGEAMPVILTTPDEVETWMTAPQDEALKAAAVAGRGVADRRPRRKGRSCPSHLEYSERSEALLTTKLMCRSTKSKMTLELLPCGHFFQRKQLEARNPGKKIDLVEDA